VALPHFGVRRAMLRRLIFLASLTACLLPSDILEGVRIQASASEWSVIALTINNPTSYWSEHGFVRLEPAVRMSVIPGAETAIFVHIPEGRRVITRFLHDQARYTIALPPGSSADRVSYSKRPDGSQVIDDVRGTRWDDYGTEFLHVYRPTSDVPNSPLAGFEWPRHDSRLQKMATEQITAFMQLTGQRYPSLRASRSDLARFRRLNNCGFCHFSNKPSAQTTDDELPPWPTDALGLYVPLAVLGDSAPLSATPFFDDPNAGDPFVSAGCGLGAATVLRSGSSRWFTCSDGSVPMGHYDLKDALLADDDHGQLACAARRYLFNRLDDLGQVVFAPAMMACSGQHR